MLINSSICYQSSYIFFKCAKSINVEKISLSQKVSTFVAPLFKAGSSVFLLIFGSLESISSLRVKDQPLLETLKIETNVSQKNSLSYLGTHGTLLVGTGLCNGLEALQLCSLIDLGSLFSKISSLGGLLFLYANFVALEENIELYELSSQISEYTSPAQQKIISWMRQSSAFGILSTLGYILTAASVLFGASATLSIFIGMVSACFGGLKILSDFVAWLKDLNYDCLLPVSQH